MDCLTFISLRFVGASILVYAAQQSTHKHKTYSQARVARLLNIDADCRLRHPQWQSPYRSTVRLLPPPPERIEEGQPTPPVKKPPGIEILRGQER